MKIAMFTNTYLPHVGGVARSVDAFSRAYERLGNEVMIVAPEFEGQPEHERNVIRIPAIQHFNGSDFSVVLPIASLLLDRLESFSPDILHAHHPFLLGNTAARLARSRGTPLVFTHHTLYEKYTHYVPADSPTMKRFAIELAVAYTNLCDLVFAPSESIADLLRTRGTKTRIEVVSTGVDLMQFRDASRSRFRQAHNIDSKAFVVGHVGRLAPEKNLEFLSAALAVFVEHTPNAVAVVAGRGPSGSSFEDAFERRRIGHRLIRRDVLESRELADCYSAMDVFAFSSTSETQGMVLIEAMAAGTPVVAIDAPGVREVVEDGHNGRLLHGPSVSAFSSALSWVATRDQSGVEELRAAARATAERNSLELCAEKALDNYLQLSRKHTAGPAAHSLWSTFAHRLQIEWDLIMSEASALRRAFNEHDVP